MYIRLNDEAFMQKQLNVQDINWKQLWRFYLESKRQINNFYCAKFQAYTKVKRLLQRTPTQPKQLAPMAHLFHPFVISESPSLPLWEPTDCSPPRSSVHGISQARILEWVAISSFRGSSWLRDWIYVSSVSYIGRGILYPCATWEALFYPYSYFRRKLFQNVPSNEECFYETAELIEELSSLALVPEPQMVHRPM